MKVYVALFILTITVAQAQVVTIPQKIGHADWEYIFSRMPQYKQIENELKSYEQQLQNQLNLKAKELEVKYKAYQELPATTPDAIRKDRESEITYMQENLQKFQQEARLSMQKKENDLVAPILEKVGKAIEEVAKENGYSTSSVRKIQALMCCYMLMKNMISLTWC